MEKLPNSKKRVVIKKGKKITTKNPEFVIALSKYLIKILKPLSKKIEIVGSIRRRKSNPIDIDLVIIPKNKEKIIQTLNKYGRYKLGGEHKIAYNIKGVLVEIYFANSTNWGAMILTYTGSYGNNIGLRVIAKKQGMLLNQYGLFKNKKLIASKNEKEIYKSLNKTYTLPEKRN